MVAIFLAILLLPVFPVNAMEPSPINKYEVQIQAYTNDFQSNVFTLTVHVPKAGTYKIAYEYAVYGNPGELIKPHLLLLNFTGLPGETYNNSNFSYPTNNFDFYTYENLTVLRWQAENGSITNYLVLIDKLVKVVAKYKPAHIVQGQLNGSYIFFDGPTWSFRVPVEELSKYYPKSLLNDLGATIYLNITNIGLTEVTIEKDLLIYPRHLSYWKTNGKVYVGVNFSTGVELNANQSIPILLYSKGKLKPLVDVLRLITPQGDPLRNLKNPATPVNVTPTSPYDALFYYPFSHFYELQYSLVSNGTSAILIVTNGDAFVPMDVEPPSVIPSYYPYLVVNGTPRFLNLSPTVRQFNLSDWSLYQFKFSVWRSHYELLWEESPPVLNSSIAYVLDGTCWRLINNFHNSPGFVANGTVEGNYMVFRFNRTTLRIPLRELAKYYPPKVWGWQLAAAKDGKGYLIIPTAGFDYTDFGFGGVILGWGDYVLLVDNSSSVYALYYVNGSLKPVFDLLRLMSLQGDWVRNLPNPFNSSVSFGLCSAERRGNANSSTIRVSRNTTTTIRENTTLPSTNTTGGANETPVHSNKTRTNTTTTPTSTTTKEKNICGPGLVVITAILPLLLRRHRN